MTQLHLRRAQPSESREVRERIARRQRHLVRFIELKAPGPMLIFAARSYLVALEGGAYRAIGRWLVEALLSSVLSRRDRLMVWWWRRVLRLTDDEIDARIEEWV